MKKSLCLVLNLFAIFSLAGCGSRGGQGESGSGDSTSNKSESLVSESSSNSSSKASDTFTPSYDKNTEARIRVVGNYSNFEALETEFDRFNVYYPEVTLEYVKLDKYETNLPTVLEGNSKPNIFFSEPKMIGNETYATVVNHMEELSDPELGINLDCLRGNLINHDKDNKTYMVPIFSRTYGTLVNKDLFTSAGLQLPTTWTELLTVCEQFKTKGYENPMMGYSKDNKPSSGLMNVIAYPYFISELSKNPEALELANNLDQRAGEYMRKGLEAVDQLVKNSCFNIESCDQIGDNYEKLLLRFFEGDVPMMVCNGDIVSGAKKRESKSEAYKNNPFKYTFYPIPVTEEGGFFIDSPSVEFSVNKDCDDLDMTNEFMKFLVRTSELDDMASQKGLISPTKTTPFEANYAAFNDVPAERTISPEVIGVKDTLTTQIRLASYMVGKGEITVDEAVERYGSFE